MKRIKLDSVGRSDVQALQELLEHCLVDNIPVLGVVAVIGSTAEGAVDPLRKIVALRNVYRKKGLDFYLHADAAWGGYCATMIDRKLVRPVQDEQTKGVQSPTPSATRTVAPEHSTFVPTLPLSKYVQKQLLRLRWTDSITVDPHKSGYIQYPAGAICYRNKVTRDMLTYRAPYITPTCSDDAPPDLSVGLFGIDGSRSGAAAAATYLHHKVVGLNPHGHGMLLKQANFTLKKIFALLATTASEDDPFRIGQVAPHPFLQLPSFKFGSGTNLFFKFSFKSLQKVVCQLCAGPLNIPMTRLSMIPTL